MELFKNIELLKIWISYYGNEYGYWM